jgi:hypothetical protein
MLKKSTNFRSQAMQLPYGDQALFITAARFRSMGQCRQPTYVLQRLSLDRFAALTALLCCAPLSPLLLPHASLLCSCLMPHSSPLASCLSSLLLPHASLLSSCLMPLSYAHASCLTPLLLPHASLLSSCLMPLSSPLASCLSPMLMPHVSLLSSPDGSLALRMRYRSCQLIACLTLAVSGR